jgi:hypothetical protein
VIKKSREMSRDLRAKKSRDTSREMGRDKEAFS